MKRSLLFCTAVLLIGSALLKAQTTALWVFDERQGLYPSAVTSDISGNDYPLVLGLRGALVDGKYGNALASVEKRNTIIPMGEERFGLQRMKPAEGRTVPPLSWYTALYPAFMTSADSHLRKEVGFPHPTKTKLNLGGFDWTVEFWLQINAGSSGNGVVFETGTGPRGDNPEVTRLLYDARAKTFNLENPGLQSGAKLSAGSVNDDDWTHYAFTYEAASNTLSLFVNGSKTDEASSTTIAELPEGEEDYMTLLCDGLFERHLPGAIDELRFSEGRVYTKDFSPPRSFSPVVRDNHPQVTLIKGPVPLEKTERDGVYQLGGRKHLFIDDMMIASHTGVELVVNPPKRAERVITNIEGPFRKHLTVLEDDDGLIRIYNSIHDDYLAVRVAEDGINFRRPDFGKEYKGQKNIVIHESVGGLGNPFIDPNGPDEHRWKYITGYHRRGIYLYTSPDGYDWTRHNIALLPFRSGTQSCTFYDDQRQIYTGYHRTGIFHTPAGATRRGTSLTTATNLYEPWDYTPMTQRDYVDSMQVLPLRPLQPWWLDNGPLTPGGFGLELPHRFGPIPEDPVGTDIYVTKAQKYEWAPDTYVAFPIVYFHYEEDGPLARNILLHEDRGLGSGPIETQISVSRDGLNWERYPRPAYVAPGKHAGKDVITAYIAQGMVKRGNELWQYYFGETHYHSAWARDPDGNAVYRLVQRLDGFVSVDSPYDKEVEMVTKPFTFEGNRLELNVDTDAAGYVRVAIINEDGTPIPGFGIEDCIYINGDFYDKEVEWLDKGFDVSQLQGKPIRLKFSMRGSKLYAIQFTGKE